MRDRVVDGIAHRAVAPLTPRDQKPALRMRVELMHPREQLYAGHTRQPLPGERERDLGALVGEPLERAERSLGRGLAHDRVVARVPIPQLLRTAAEGLAIVVDG